jgi:hypothetical protein
MTAPWPGWPHYPPPPSHVPQAHGGWHPPEYAPAITHEPMPQGAFREGQREGLDQHPGAKDWHQVDHMRWGDADSFSVTGIDALLTGTSRQLVRCNAPRPIVWLVQFQAAVSQFPASQTNGVTVRFAITIGCGQSQNTVFSDVILLAANNYQIPVGTPSPQIFVPASDLQIVAQVSFVPNVNPGTVLTFAVGAMAAPFTRWD